MRVHKKRKDKDQNLYFCREIVSNNEVTNNWEGVKPQANLNSWKEKRLQSKVLKT